GQIPTTIGIASIVLLALRRGVEQGRGPISEFLAAHFGPAYRELLASKGLGRCLDRIRVRLRTPACHGTASCPAADYREFPRLLSANTRFAAWDALGADPPDPAADEGLLHHHLAQARGSCAPPDHGDTVAICSLLALHTPGASTLNIDLAVTRVDSDPRMSAGRPWARVGDHSFRLG